MAALKLINISSQTIRLHKDHLDAIASLVPFTAVVDGRTVSVSYVVVDSMHDGKEVTVLTKDILR